MTLDNDVVTILYCYLLLNEFILAETIRIYGQVLIIDN